MLIKTNEGKVVGNYEHGVFSKNVKGSTHMMRSPLGWQVDRDIIENLDRLGCYEIHITDRETGILYYAKYDDFVANAIPINRGFGDQMVLPLNLWAYEKPIK